MHYSLVENGEYACYASLRCRRSKPSVYFQMTIMYRSNRSFNMPPPRAFDTFAVPGRREFDYQSLPGGGEFDPRALGVGNLNCTLDFM